MTMTDSRWYKQCTDWQPTRGNRPRGRPNTKWQANTKKGEGGGGEEGEGGGSLEQDSTGQSTVEGYVLQWMDKTRIKSYIYIYIYI